MAEGNIQNGRSCKFCSAAEVSLPTYIFLQILFGEDPLNNFFLHICPKDLYLSIDLHPLVILVNAFSVKGSLFVLWAGQEKHFYLFYRWWC